MSTTVTLRLDDKIYRKFRGMADNDNRPLSNFIETAVLRFIEDHEYVDEFEMAEIKGNARLNKSIKSGLGDAKARKGKPTHRNKRISTPFQRAGYRSK